MKKLSNVVKSIGSIIASVALMLGVYSVQQAVCFIFYHQPKVPNGMMEYKK